MSDNPEGAGPSSVASDTHKQDLYVPPRAGPSVSFMGLGTTYKVRGHMVSGRLAVVEHTLEPGCLGSPLHTHTREDELSYVLEGELTAQVGGDVLRVPTGGVLVKPRGIPHAFWNAGSVPLRFLETITPGGFEQYFEDVAPIFAVGGPPDFAALMAVCARYGLEMDPGSVPVLMERHGLRG